MYTEPSALRRTTAPEGAMRTARTLCVAVISRGGASEIGGAALVVGLERRALTREAGKERCRLPPLAELTMERGDAFVDLGESDSVGVEHRSSAPRWKAVTARVDDVDVGGAARVAFFEHAGAFVDQRVDRALDDFLIAEWASTNAGRSGRTLDERQHLGIGRRLSVLAVDIPALAGLLSEPAHFAQCVGNERLAIARPAELFQFLANTPRHIESRHIVHRKHPHCHTEAGEGAVDLLGGCAILNEELRLVHVREHHSIADEPFAVADDDAHLAEAFGDGHRCGEGLW